MTIVLSHALVCRAEPWRVFSIIATPEDWPALFEPCLAVDIINRTNGVEQIEVTATVNGRPHTWQSRRTLDQASLKIDAEMTAPFALVAAMRTRWRVYGLGKQESLLVLEHNCDLVPQVDGQIAGVETRVQAENWVKTAINTNSAIELENIRQHAERLIGTAKGRDGLYQASHMVICEAPADLVFPLVADPSRWPDLFKACLAVEALPSENEWQIVRIHADQGGSTTSWTTRRRVDDDAFIVDFELIDPMPYTAAMSGRWRVVPLGPEQCLLAVDRTWSIADPVAHLRSDITNTRDAAAFVAQFVETNARCEMEAIAAMAASGHTATMLFVETQVDVEVSADKIYRALVNAAAWPSFAPHCRSLRVSFDDGIHQELQFEIETLTGDKETIRSFRVCDHINRSISFVQVEPPRALDRHHGSWSIKPTANGARVTCHHFATPKQTFVAGPEAKRWKSQHDETLRKTIEANSQAIVMACVAHIKSCCEEAA